MNAHENHMYHGEVWRPRAPSSTCEQFESNAFDAPSDWKRYPWHPNVRNRLRPLTAFGTAYAQEVIWAHQHPSSCSGVRFLAMYHWPIGMGALLHFLGRALGLAMQRGRILVLAEEGFGNDVVWPGPGGLPWYDPTHCPGRRSWECWFQNLTNCTAPQLRRENAEQDVVQILWPSELPLWRSSNFTWHYIPDVLHGMLRKCSHIKRELEFYWWHAQAVTYIVRFNKHTRQVLNQMRHDLLHVWRRGSTFPRKLDALPKGTVAMHVRHGDKASEMRLLPFSKYIEHAKLLAANSNVRVLDGKVSDSHREFTYQSSSFSDRWLFVSTENPDVIEEAVRLSEAQEDGWSVIYNNEPRTNVDVVTMRKQRGNGRATLESFLNLEIAIEADAWVCTLSSNWCQLIDELRMTVGAKAGAPFINLLHDGFRYGEDCFGFRRCYVYQTR